MTVTLDGIFNEGTVSIANGSDILNFTGTFLLGTSVVFDHVYVANSSVLIKEIISDTQARAAVPWTAASIVNQPFAWYFDSRRRSDGSETRATIQDFALYAKRGGFRGKRGVTAAADAIGVDDLERSVTYNRPTAIAASIPQANTNKQFVDGWRVWVRNKGAGTVTYTPAGCTIGGSATFDLKQGWGALIESQDGNYEIYLFTSADMRNADNLAGLSNKAAARANLGLDAGGMTVVRVVATANVDTASALVNAAMLDDIALATGDMVLLSAQTAPAQNGVYVVAASGTASRAPLYATYNSLCGRYFSVSEGTAGGEKLYRCTSDNGGTIGATAIAIEEYKRGVRYDAAQTTTAMERTTARSNISAAPFDALAANNPLINSGFSIDQEFAGSSIAFLAGGTFGKYIIDGWNVSKTGTGAFTAQRVASGYPGIPYAMRFTCTTAQPVIGSDTIILEQRVEGYRFARAGWGTASGVPIVVSLLIRSSIGGTLVGNLQNNAQSIGTSDNAVLTAGSTYQLLQFTMNPIATDTWLTTNGIGCRFNIVLMNSTGTPFNLVSAVGNTIDIAGCVITFGTQKPSLADFARLIRSDDQELQICQRYYEKSYSLAVTPGANVGNGNGGVYGLVSGNYFTGTIPYKANKRANPSLTVYDTTGTSGKITHYNAGVTTNGQNPPNSFSSTSSYIYQGFAGIQFANWDFVADSRL